MQLVVMETRVVEETFVVDPVGDPTDEGALKQYITINRVRNVDHVNNQVTCSEIARSVIAKLAEDGVTTHGALRAPITVD